MTRNEQAIRRLDEVRPLESEGRSLVQVANDSSHTGRVIGGRFEVQGQLTCDSFGLLLAAVDRKADRLVSLRVVRSARVASRLGPQLSAVANVTHPCLHAAIGVLRPSCPSTAATFDDDEGSTFLVQGALEGLPVASQVEARRLAGTSIGLREACRIVTAVSGALTAAHVSGPHGAVGPETIWTDSKGKVLLTDLVLSRALLETDGTGNDGRNARKTLFLAPEVRRGGPPHRAGDVYGLSALLYLLLTGRPPTEGGDAPSRLHGEVTRALDAVIKRGLSLNPTVRHASPAVFQAAMLEAVRASKREAARASKREAPRVELPKLLSPIPPAQPSDSCGPCAPTLPPSLPRLVSTGEVPASNTTPGPRPLRQPDSVIPPVEHAPTVPTEVLHVEVHPPIHVEVSPPINVEVYPARHVDLPTLGEDRAPEVVVSNDEVESRASEGVAAWVRRQGQVSMIRAGLCLLLLASLLVLVRAQGSAEHDLRLVRAETELSAIQKNFHRQQAEQFLLAQAGALGQVPFVLDSSGREKRGLATKTSQTVWVRPLAAVSLENLGQIEAHAQPGSPVTVHALDIKALASSLAWRLTRTGHDGAPTLKGVELFWAEVDEEDVRLERQVTELRKQSLEARRALIDSKRTVSRLAARRRVSTAARARYEEAAQRAERVRERAAARGISRVAAARVTVSYGAEEVRFDVPVPVSAHSVPVAPRVPLSLAATRVTGSWHTLKDQTPEAALAIVTSRIPWHARPMAILGIEFRGIRLLQFLPCILLALLGLVSLRLQRRAQCAAPAPSARG